MTDLPNPTDHSGAPTVSCTELGSIWTGGTAALRTDGSGYDTTACSPSGRAGIAELVKPALRDPSQWETARCNDGSPFGFQVRLSSKGFSPEWVILLEGGGWCDDHSKTCARRVPALSSTPSGGDGALAPLPSNLGGIFNLDSAQNPTFHDVNHVYAPYCSSDLWSGTTAELRRTDNVPEGLFFTGSLNVGAMMETLIQSYGLDDSNPETRVLFTGTSAGGLGVEANAHVLAGLLPRTASAGRLKLVDDGGFLVDWDDPQYRLESETIPIRDVMERNYDLWGSSLNPLCEQAQRAAGQHPGSCFMTAVVYPYNTDPPPMGLGLPLLIQFSQADSNSTEGQGIDNPQDPEDRAALERWRAETLEELEGIAWVFSGGRPYHTLLTRDSARDGWNLGPDGETFREVLTRFWEGGPPERVIFGNP